MFYDDDADLHLLDGKTVAIIGYGSQGHAHALNLKDSGVAVVVGLRSGLNQRREGQEHGSRCSSPPTPPAQGDLVMMLVPDELHPGLGVGRQGRDRRRQHAAVRPRLLDPLRAGRAAAGRRRRVGRPKGPGTSSAASSSRVGRALPGRGPSGPQRQRAGVALAYAKGIGGTRGGRDRDDVQGRDRDRPVRRAGRAVRRRHRAGRGRLRDARRAGYDPRLAYFECLHELKLIVDLMYEKGIAGMRYSISNTAEYGDLTRGKRVIGDPTARR